MAAWRTSLTIPFSLEEDLLLLSHLSTSHHLFIFPPSSHLHSNRLLPRKGDGGEQQHGGLFGEETRHLEGHRASEESEENERAFFNSMYFSTPSTNPKSWFPAYGFPSHHHSNSSSQPLPPTPAKGASSTSGSHSSSCDCSVEDWLVFIAKHDLHHRDVTSIQKRIRVLHRFSLRIASSSSSSSSIPSSSSTSSSSSSSFSRFLCCSSSSKSPHAGGLGERLQTLKKSQRKEEKEQQHTVLREGIAGSPAVYSGELSSGGSQGGKESGVFSRGEEQNPQRRGGNEAKGDFEEGERGRKEQEWSSRDNGKEKRQERHAIDVFEKGMREQERGREEEKELHPHQRDRRDEVPSSTLSSTFSSCSSAVSIDPTPKEHPTPSQPLPQPEARTPEESQIGTLSLRHTTTSSSSSFSLSSSSLSCSSSLPRESLHAARSHPLSPDGDASSERKNQDSDNRNGSLQGDILQEMKASPSPSLLRKANPLLALLSPALMKWSSDETRALSNTRHPSTSIQTRDLASFHTGSPLPIVPKIHLSSLSLSSPAPAAAAAAISSSFLSSSSFIAPPPPSFSFPSVALAPEISSGSLLSSSSATAGGGAAGLPSSSLSSETRMFSLASLSAVCLGASGEKRKEDFSSSRLTCRQTHPMLLALSEEEKKTRESFSDRDVLAKKKRRTGEGKDEERLAPEEKKDDSSSSRCGMAYRRRTTSSDSQLHSSHSSFIDVSQAISFHADRDEGEKEPPVFTELPPADQPLYNDRSLDGQPKDQENSSSFLLVHRSVSPGQGSSDLHLRAHTQQLHGEGDTHASPQPLLPSASHLTIPTPLHPSPSSSSSHHYHQDYHRAGHSTGSQVDFSSSHLVSRLPNHSQQQKETGNVLNRSLLEKNQYENLRFLEAQEKNLLHCQLPYFGGPHDNVKKKSLSSSLPSFREREKSSYAPVDPSRDAIHKAFHHTSPLVHLSPSDSSPAKLHEEKLSLGDREEHSRLSPPSLFLAHRKDEKAALSSSSFGDLHVNQKDVAVGVAGEVPRHQEKERRDECGAKERLSEETKARFNADERREEGQPGGEEEMSIMKQSREEKGKEEEKLRDTSPVVLSSGSNSTTASGSSERGRKEKEDDSLDTTRQRNNSSHTSHHKSKEPGRGEGEGGEREVFSPEGKIKKNASSSSSSSSTTSKGLHSRLRNRDFICAPFYQDVTSIAEALDEIPCDFFLDSINCGLPPAMVTQHQILVMSMHLLFSPCNRFSLLEEIKRSLHSFSLSYLNASTPPVYDLAYTSM